MIRAYFASAAGLIVAGQVSASPAGAMLDQALATDPSWGPILDEAKNLSTIGISPTDAAVIVALSGLAWKFLDTQQKGGTIDTLNLWLRRKLRVDQPNPPPPPPR